MRLLLAIASLITHLTFCPPAFAGEQRLGYEFSLGGGRFLKTDSYVGQEASTAFSLSQHLGFFFNFHESYFNIYVGVIEKYSSFKSTSVEAFSALAIYPALRIKAWRFSLTGGLTPFSFKGEGAIPFSRDVGQLSAYGDFFYEQPVTPYFSFILGGSAQFFRLTSDKAPMSYDGIVGFKVLFGPKHSGPEKYKGPNQLEEFNDWRYPGGNVRKR